MISHMLFRSVKVGLRLVIIALFVAALGLAGIAIFGFPEGLKDRITLMIQEHYGIVIDAERIFYRPWGWVISEVTVYDQNPDHLNPVLEAERLVIDSHLPFKRWDMGLSNEVTVSSLRMLKEAVGISDAVESWLYVEHVQFEISREGSQFSFSEGRFSNRFAELSFSGDVKRLVSEKSPEDSRNPSSNRDVDPSSKIADIVALLELNEPIMGNVVFSADVCDQKLAVLHLSIDLAGGMVAGIEVDKLEGEFEYRDQAVRVDSVSCFVGEEVIALSGFYDGADQLIQFQCNSSFDVSKLDAPFIVELNELFKQYGFTIEELSSLSVNVPSGPVETMLQRLSGNAQVCVEEVSGLLVEPIDFAFMGHSSGWIVDAPQILLSDTDSEDQLKLCMVCSRDFKHTRLSLDVEAATSLIDRLAFANPDVKEFLSRVSSAGLNSVVKSEIEVSGLGEESSVWSGSVAAQNIRYHTVYFSDLSGHFSFSDNRLKVSQVLGKQKSDECLKGLFEVNFASKYFSGELLSGLSLREIEDMVGVETGIFHDAFDVEGASRFTFSGGVSYDSFYDAVFSASLSAERFRSGDKVLNQVESSWRGSGSRLELEDLSGGFLGGILSSDGAVVFDAGEEHGWFNGIVELTGAPIDQFMDTTVDAELNVEGRLRFDTTRKAVESSDSVFAVDLKGDQLAELPVLNDLSSVLGSVWKPLDLFSINQMGGDIYWRKNQFVTDNLIFSGNLFEGRLKGSYDLEAGYDAVLRIQLNETSDIKKVLRILTKPFFRILDLNLSGNINEAEWSLRRIDEIVR